MESKQGLAGSMRTIIAAGKKNQGDKKRQTYINLSFFAGIACLFVWQTVYFKYAFVPVGVVWALVLAPGLIVSIFAFRKYLGICGYAAQGSLRYRLLMRFLVFGLIAMPVGNFTALSFFVANDVFAKKHSAMITVKPSDIYNATTKGRRYTSFDIIVGGESKTKRINGKHAADSLAGQLIEARIRTGYFGYPIMDEYQLK